MPGKLLAIASGLAVSLMLAALPVQAEPYNFGDNVGNTVKLTIQPYASGEVNSGFFVGLTQAYIDGDSTNPFYVYCIDFAHDISLPTSYDVVIKSLDPANPNNQPSFQINPNLNLTLATLQLQAAMGWNFGVAPSGDSVQDGDIQKDIWNLSGGNFTPPNANMTAIYNAAVATAASADYSDQYFFDITGEPGQQAFMPVDTQAITTHSVPATPEPATWGLMAGALMAMVFGVRRRAARNAA